MLKWAREHGCPWRELDEEGSELILNCCALAAYGGHLQVLKWLREHDCPWDELSRFIIETSQCVPALQL
jgi:hypothetical protein